MPTIRQSILSLLLTLLSYTALAQSNLSQFGQNRVQYKKMIWSFYETDNFNIYFYQGGQDLGRFIIENAEQELDSIKATLDLNMKIPIDILVYQDLSDLNQTNIGIYNQPDNIGGTTKILDNKIFLHFNGSHEDLLRQFREGVTRIYLDKLMVGASFQEVIQNAVLLNLPPWFTEGLVRYMGRSWSSEDENRLKYGVLSGNYKKFRKIPPDELVFIGYSLWHFVEEKYGRAAVSNLLYLTRINRSVEQGFMFVVGKSVNETFNEWYRYYTERYKKEREKFEQPDAVNHLKVKFRKKQTYFDLAVSDDEEYIAYASDIMGLKRVFIQEIGKTKRKRILKYGFKTKTIVTDNSYPLIAFEPGSEKVIVIYNKRDKIKMLTYELETGKKETSEIRKFQKIFGIAYAGDKENLLVSGMQKGQCDLFKYYLPSTNTTNLTNDVYDDIDPAYVEIDGKRTAVFSSNRPDTELKETNLDSAQPKKTFDLFMYDFGAERNELIRITETPNINESSPQALSSKHLTYLSDKNGIRNRYAAKLEPQFSHNEVIHYYINLDNGRPDSAITREGVPLDSIMDTEDIRVSETKKKAVYELKGKSAPISRYSANLTSQVITPTATSYNVYKDEKDGMIFFTERIDTSDLDKIQDLDKTGWGERLQNQKTNRTEKSNASTSENEEKTEKVKEPEESGPTGEIFYFQSPFDHLFQPSDTLEDVVFYTYDKPDLGLEQEADEENNYQFTRTKNYRVRFYTEKVVTQLDNQILMTRYQVFNPNSPVFNNPSFGGLLEVGITDLLENHKIRGGIKIPTNFEQSEFYVSYENLTKRIDKKFLYYRRSIENTTSAQEIPFNNLPVPGYLQNNSFRHVIKTNYLEASFKYAINIPQSIRWAVAFRNDQYIHKSTDNFTLQLPNYNDNWVFTRLDYVFDNTIDIGLNLKNGSRFNLFFEFHKQIPAEEDTIFGGWEIPLPQFNDAYFTVAGFDFRHYQKVHRNIVWATRITGAASWGNRKLVFYLGGIDNWLIPQFDEQTQVNLENNYAFQTIATNMRGFKQNVRNGNNYFVVNTEIRFPVFSYLIKSPIKSEFIRNFHIVGFTDVGTAWEFGSPFKRKPFVVAEFPDPNNLINGRPQVSVEVEKLKNPIVAGFGTGLRMSLFGYFIRTDVAWGWDSGIISAPVWYISLGLDF